MTKSAQIRLSISSRLEDVRLVGVAVLGICKHISVPEGEASLMETCVVEAVNNIIEHAYLFEEDRKISVDVDCQPGKINFKVCDTGISMGELITPTLEFSPDDIDSIPEGGMGLFIIHQVMDEVYYDSLSGVNTMCMIRSFNPSGDSNEG